MSHPLNQEREPSPAPKLEPGTGSVSWMENDEYPDLYRPEKSVYDLTRELADRPLVRPLALRPNRKITYLHNKSHGLRNYTTALAYQRGTAQVPTCENCAGPKPGGPYKHCIAMGEMFHGSCTNCAYNGNSSKCSFRFAKDANVSSTPDTIGRDAAINGEMEVDYTSTRAPNLETDAEDGPSSTLRKALKDQERTYVKRKAAADAQSKMSKYTYGDTDVLSVDDTTNSEAGKSGLGLDENCRESHQPPARPTPPRGSFKARRGGHRLSSGRKQSEGSENTATRKRTATLESGEEDDEPFAQRRKSSVNTTPLHVKEEKSPPVPHIIPNNLTFAQIPLPSNTSLVTRQLLQMSPKRNATFNEACNRNIKHACNIETTLGFCVGDVVPAPCERCARNVGAFTKCVVVAGHFQGSCTSCYWNGAGRNCQFHANTKFGEPIKSPVSSAPAKPVATANVLEHPTGSQSMPSRPPAKVAPQAQPVPQKQVLQTMPIAHKSKTEYCSYDTATASTPSKIVTEKQDIKADTPKRERSSITPGKSVRSQRYLKALNEAQEMTLEEQQLDLSELKFKISVLNNIITNVNPSSQTSRYKNEQTRFEEMTPEEQQFELASLKFKLSVMQDAVIEDN